MAKTYPVTPDGRYFVVKSRLWRKSDPRLDEPTVERLVKELMSARRAVRDAKQKIRSGAEADVAKARDLLAAARRRVDAAKVSLGERGPVWWEDGSPDYNRHLVRNSPYAEWFAALPGGKEEASGSIATFASGRGTPTSKCRNHQNH